MITIIMITEMGKGLGILLGEVALQKIESPFDLLLCGKGFINAVLVMLYLNAVMCGELFN